MVICIIITLLIQLPLLFPPVLAEWLYGCQYPFTRRQVYNSSDIVQCTIHTLLYARRMKWFATLTTVEMRCKSFTSHLYATLFLPFHPPRTAPPFLCTKTIFLGKYLPIHLISLPLIRHYSTCHRLVCRKATICLEIDTKHRRGCFQIQSSQG